MIPEREGDAPWCLSGGIAAEVEEIPFAFRTAVAGACRNLLQTRGRMWRGRLLLASADQGPNPNAEAVQAAATAVELLHLATLAHDDVIDDGDTRRGEPSTNVLFGARVAGFAGVAIFARSVEIAAGCGASVARRITEASRCMCEGGMLELRQSGDLSRTLEQCIDVADRKTASAFELAATLGSGLANASEETTQRSGRIGRRFGLAYQVWDDLIDIVAPPSYSGKGHLADLRQGLFTLPVLYAVEESPEIAEWIGDFQTGAIAENELEDKILATSAIERTRSFASNLIDEARTEALELPCPSTILKFISEAELYHARAMDGD